MTSLLWISMWTVLASGQPELTALDRQVLTDVTEASASQELVVAVTGDRILWGEESAVDAGAWCAGVSVDMAGSVAAAIGWRSPSLELGVGWTSTRDAAVDEARLTLSIFF
jgi:hypothetical protein